MGSWDEGVRVVFIREVYEWMNELSVFGEQLVMSKEEQKKHHWRCSDGDDDVAVSYNALVAFVYL